MKFDKIKYCTEKAMPQYYIVHTQFVVPSYVLCRTQLENKGMKSICIIAKIEVYFQPLNCKNVGQRVTNILYSGHAKTIVHSMESVVYTNAQF